MLTPFGKCVLKKRGHGPYILLDVVTSDGHIVAQKQNSAVSSDSFQKFGVERWKVLLIWTLYVVSDSKQSQQDIHITIGAQVT